jgi:hypothetical protein
MILYVDNENKVRAVNTTTDTSLTPLYVDENNESFPFKGMSNEGICCYKVTVNEGVITMFTPYKDSRLIGPIDDLGHKIDKIMPYEETKTVSYGDTEIMFENVPQGNLTVLVKDSEGNYPIHHATRKDDVVKVEFAPLEYAADVTITIQ